jgi:hypothetical protein
MGPTNSGIDRGVGFIIQAMVVSIAGRWCHRGQNKQDTDCAHRAQAIVYCREHKTSHADRLSVGKSGGGSMQKFLPGGYCVSAVGPTKNGLEP